MKKTKAKTEYLRRGAMDGEKKQFTLLTVDVLLDRLADIDPLCESTAQEYNLMRGTLFEILAHEVPDRSDLFAKKNRHHRGF